MNSTGSNQVVRNRRMADGFRSDSGGLARFGRGHRGGRRRGGRTEPRVEVGRAGPARDRGRNRRRRAFAHGLSRRHQRALAQEHRRRCDVRRRRELAGHRIDLSRHGSARSQRGLCRRLQDDRRRSHLERLAASAWPHDGRRSHEFERGVHGFRRRGKEHRRWPDLGRLLRRIGWGTHLFAVDQSFPSGRALRRHQRQRGASLHRRRGHLELDRRTGNERVVGPRRPG